MDDRFQIRQINQTLYLINKVTDKKIVDHRPFGSKFKEYRRVKPNCNIIHEHEEGFPKDTNGNQANIYCLDDEFNTKWTIQLPMENDVFPNPIQWNKEMIEIKTPTGFLTVESADNPKTFTCASWRGFTVTVDYETGQTKNVEFTK